VGEVPFEKVILDRDFRAEGCAIADINRDGKPDIVAGDSWYEAPKWEKHIFRTVGKVRSYRDLRYDYPEDVNGDGWLDVLSVRFDRNVVWFENPKGKEGQWIERTIGEFDLCEGVFYGDLDGDGKGDFVGPFHPPAICWYESGADPGAPWTRRQIGPRAGDRHGIGIGDVDRDGRNDVLTKDGWYEAPEDPREGEWKFREVPLGDCFVIYTYDVDGDGDNDLISSSPHNYGVWWWEQSTTVAEVWNGNLPKRFEKTAWLRHLIDKSFSQAHALALADLDGDGDKDLLSGKRYYAHEGRDPGANEPAVLLWFELQRDNGKVRWIRHEIDDDSGVGYQIAVGDIDGDCNPEIVTCNKKGVFLFRNKSPQRWTRLFTTPAELAGWVGDRKLWTVENGVLIGRSPGIPRNSFLVSQEEVSDFILKLSVRLRPDAGNSGVQFRSEALEGGAVKGYQADIGEGWWGSLYDEHGRGLLVDGYKGKGDKAVRKGQWNDYVIRAIRDHIQIEINGTITTDIRDEGRRQGILAFQVHSGGPFEIAFKDVLLREITRGAEQ
jgi:hypothetical protein